MHSLSLSFSLSLSLSLSLSHTHTHTHTLNSSSSSKSLSVCELVFFLLEPALTADDDFFDAVGGALGSLGLGGADLVGGVDIVFLECFAVRSALRMA